MLPLSKQLLVDCESEEIEYDGHCMNAPKEILDFFTETVKKVNLSDFYDIILSMGKNNLITAGPGDVKISFANI